MNEITFDIKRDTITYQGIVFDVERSDRDGRTILTVERDGEDAFPGLTAEIGYDEFAQEHHNPRDWSNVGTMLVNYRGYSLGDGENDDEDGGFYLPCNVCTGHGTVDVEGPQTEADARYWGGLVEYRCERCDGDGRIMVDPAAYYRETRGATVVLPLFVYEHSGITIRSGAPLGPVVSRDDLRSTGRFTGDSAGWDTSFVGFVFDTPEGIEQCIGKGATREQIIAALESEVSVYASYLEGDVTEYAVEDIETGLSDSCGGFVGDRDEAQRQCFDVLADAVVRRFAEAAERAHWAERDTITV